MKHPGHTYGGLVPTISERGMTPASRHLGPATTLASAQRSRPERLWSRVRNELVTDRVHPLSKFVVIRRDLLPIGDRAEIVSTSATSRWIFPYK
jgi:hypothetical protein